MLQLIGYTLECHRSSCFNKERSYTFRYRKRGLYFMVYDEKYIVKIMNFKSELKNSCHSLSYFHIS